MTSVLILTVNPENDRVRTIIFKCGVLSVMDVLHFLRLHSTAENLLALSLATFCSANKYSLVGNHFLMKTV